MSQYDAIIVGSGPNGLSAAVELARNGAKVLVLEAADEIGGGTRTAELTLPGFKHDYCSAVHPMGVTSPYWRQLPLAKHGLQWIHPDASVAHPLDNQPAIIMKQAIEETAAQLELDEKRWLRAIGPLAKNSEALLKDAMGPLGIPRHPFLLAYFGVQGLLPATAYARLRFKGERARALIAGCAAHSILPLEKPLTAAVGLMFALIAHNVTWPIAAGGSAAITTALANYLRELGGEIETGWTVTSPADLPPARLFLLDTDPRQLASIGAEVLPDRYLRKLNNFNYGPGVFKLDWALSDPIPWADPDCLSASTVHVGGSMAEIAASERAAWNGQHSEKPFLILCQQSQFDPTRAPAGKHTGYAYCHVPHGSDVDMTRQVEAQIERFAPGFSETILARHKSNTRALALHNRNYVGGAITGGAADMSQFFNRPVSFIDPYRTPNKRLYICSHSTPPGGGVHGMCGFHAARSALKRMASLPIAPLTN